MDAQDKARKTRILLNMVSIEVEEPIAYLTGRTFEEYSLKKGEFSIKDAIELEEKTKKLFEK